MSATKSTLRTRAFKASRQIRSQRRNISRSSQWQAPVTGAADAESQSARAYCTNLVSTYDRPSHILSAFIPRQAQTFYLALRALNVSLSMIPDTTSSHTIGLMRLQFWRDTITKTLSGSPPKEPVAILLANAIEDLSTRTDGRARLSKGWFLRMINAREQTLTNTPFPDLAALESYAENTYSTLLYLTLSSLPLTSVTVDHVASHIGKAAGISAVLRGLPLVAFPGPAKHHTNQSALLSSGGAAESKHGAITLPLDIMSQSGVIEEEVFRKGAEAAGLKDAVFAVATRASDHLITARQMLKNLRAGEDVGHEFEHEGDEGHEYTTTTTEKEQGVSPYEKQLAEVERGFGVFMPAVSTQMWLDKLQSYDFDIFNPKLLRSDWTMPWRAYYAHSKKTF
ncbi:hypothetical protein TMatcc_005499 [Talaromyces marneffei ATCC 18224]|uniref:Squalene/phytoene synthase n=2 Tax=Talaromyces marneffei TaxID=37727 RepID=B6QAE7_TALMQ|nr:uncharacterized protein EYB26_005961 [Talaromyces marneffei]EEA26243.1 conserved hypothetical protein [Talaromyces marneffei ATCC 18224]KAE8554939.1 hypothetical protein EYB25_003486 [Talaromyces marneffei]QGA18277.1 hypothetical protein EYB26_005961 [Talaromyces marneffei]